MASLDSKRECFKLIQERDIMIQIEHRQLVKLVCSSYNHDSVFFITEHIKGNSLISLLPVNLKITKHLALYFAKMIEYLHEKNIAYRDFCTENIIISSNGIPYLYNFRSAKVVENRTYTRVGNPFIRSPEMILGRGYTKSTDIWSLGVVLFELVNNKLPFKIQNNDSPVEAYEKILNLSHGFSDFIHLDLNKLLESMLSTSDLRIDVSGILRNHWFSDVEKDFLKKRPTLCDNVFGIKVKEEKRNKKVFKANKLLQVFGI
jgi:serine/threonine protein kinase